ncbi:TniQ family protein [Streptomyces rubiginosohelvolus]|uniref:TniQ family protein n=1 Tax=Streptomyces rubiginosohelvolus TaxID=67362 RepID=UPI0033A7B7ED
MTHRNNRQQDRAVRAYKRDHPGITVEEARRAVAARAEQQPGLPARIPAAPLPGPAERLDAYVQRVAAAAGVQRHHAMELLGLQPGTSATGRLEDLAAGLDDHTVRALVAATGMTADQARALTTPPTAADRIPHLEDLARRLLAEKHIQPGGSGKTRTSARDFARLLAEATGPRVLPIDMPAGQMDSYTPVIVDLDWSFGDPRPVDPDVFDEVASALGIEQDPPRQA